MKRRKLTAFTWPCLALALFSLSSMALAQMAPAVSADQSQAAEVVVYPAPPLGFDPLAASEAGLEIYGFPPRPDQATALIDRRSGLSPLACGPADPTTTPCPNAGSSAGILCWSAAFTPSIPCVKPGMSVSSCAAALARSCLRP